MRTWLIDGAARLPMDPELEALLSVSVAGELEGGGIALNLGILNARGQVYRVARSWDLTDYIVACKALERVGLSLAAKKPPPGVISFEDVFVCTPALDPAIAASIVVKRSVTRTRL